MSNLEVKQGTAYHHHCCGPYQHNSDDNVRPRKVSESFEDEKRQEDEGKGSKDGVGDDDDDMTEDEEVKRNCITGVSTMKDYDFFSSDDDLCGDDDDDDISDLDEDREESLYQHQEQQQQEQEVEEKEIIIELVQFVGREQLQQRATTCALVRPIPQIPTTTPSPQNDNEYMDENDGADGDDEQEDEDEEGNNEDIETDNDSSSENDATHQETNQQLNESDNITAVDDLDRSLSQIFPLNVGASGASVDDLCGPSKRKRVLSSNTLSMLSREAGQNADHSPKRYRPSFIADESLPTTTTVEIPFQMKIPPPPPLSFSTTSSNMEMVTHDDTRALSQIQLMRGYSRELPSGDGCDCHDRMLRDELNAIPSDRPVYCSPDTSPVPLLTPPQSPRVGESCFNDDDKQNKCEWPSNLVVDSAMMNIRQAMLRPLSAASLKDLESYDENSNVRINESSGLADKKECEPSILMPMFRFISVGDGASSRQ